MRYARIIENDIVNGEGICVSLFTQGCPHHCKGCFNQEQWNFNGGIEEDSSIVFSKILNLINKNGVKRNLSILGGEPLCKENAFYIDPLITLVKKEYPDIKIFIWTGYILEVLLKEDYNDIIIPILKNTDFLIDGPYIEEKRNITLKWRGSSNQRILTKKEIYDIIEKNKGE